MIVTLEISAEKVNMSLQRVVDQSSPTTPFESRWFLPVITCNLPFIYCSLRQGGVLNGVDEITNPINGKRSP